MNPHLRGAAEGGPVHRRPGIFSEARTAYVRARNVAVVDSSSGCHLAERDAPDNAACKVIIVCAEHIRGDVKEIRARRHVREIHPVAAGESEILRIEVPVSPNVAGNPRAADSARDTESAGRRVLIVLQSPDGHILRRRIGRDLIAAELTARIWEGRVGTDVGESLAAVGRTRGEPVSRIEDRVTD